MSEVDGQDLEQTMADRQWWEELSDCLGLGRLSGWSYRHSASFVKDGYPYQITGPLLGILLDLRESREQEKLRVDEQIAHIQETLEHTQRANRSQSHTLNLIRRRADLACGFEHTGTSHDAADRGRSVGALGAVDHLIARYAGQRELLVRDLLNTMYDIGHNFDDAHDGWLELETRLEKMAPKRERGPLTRISDDPHMQELPGAEKNEGPQS